MGNNADRRPAAKAVSAIAAATLLLLALAATALAGPPVHPRMPDLDISALDHACGVAVDSRGDVYAASAGEAKIKVFDSDHTLLTAITDANEPCGLAVNSKGELFVSEQGTGNVVRYKPNAFPFAGTPTYGGAEAIDSSGNAKGIAVDPFDDRLYVAEGGHIDAYNSDGSLYGPIDEVQAVLPFGATGGTFTLSFEGQETGTLAWNASHAEVQTALEGLAAVGAGNVAVTEGLPSWEGREHIVTFTGALGHADVKSLKADTSGLVGTGFSIEEKVKGYSGHIGVGSLAGASGLAVHTYPYPLSSAPTKYLFAVDADTDQVKVFSGTDVKTLKLRKTIGGVDQDRNPETPDQSLGFGPAGSSVGVDHAGGHFFAYDTAHSVVDEFDATGEFLDQIGSEDFADAEPTGLAVHPQLNEGQKVKVDATGGHFKLGFEGVETGEIVARVKASVVEEALEGLATIGEGNVVVSGGDSASEFAPYAIAFVGDLGNRDVEELTVDGSGLSGGGATASVSTTREGSGPGRLYVTAGSGAGAKLLAFGPLVTPARVALPALSRELANARAVATDFDGNVYVSTQTQVQVFDPEGKELTSFEVDRARDLAIDSSGNVYALEGSLSASTWAYYSPSQYPPVSETHYTGSEAILSGLGLLGAAVDPSNDHVFVLSQGFITEFGSAAENSPEVSQCGANVPNGFDLIAGRDIDVYGATGDVYVSAGVSKLLVYKCGAEEELLREFKGDGCPNGEFGANPAFAVEQSNGQLVEFAAGQSGEAAREYDAAGACLAEFGTFSSNTGSYRVAVDNSCALHDPPLTEATTPTCEEFDPAYGTAYVAFDSNNNGVQPNDLNAFGPLSYGEAPSAATGMASGLGAGNAVLDGAVDPRGFELEDCRFEFLTDAQYLSNGKTFAGAGSQACAESPVEIGEGTGAVSVHTDISGLDPEARYRFRLRAQNRYGEGKGEAGLFGPPQLTAEPALSVGYDEATLRAQVDPSGLATRYHFEYGTDDGYGQSTPTVELAPGEGSVAVKAPLAGLFEGTEYHFRIVAENEATTTIEGPDQVLVTLERAPSQDCENGEYRTGLSGGLPECRAYELVTPADTRGLTPVAQTSGGGNPYANSWFVTPRGEDAGESVAYVIGGLPGFDGTGRGDGFRAQRGAGAHPQGGWTSELYGFSFAQAGGSVGERHGIGPDQRYWLWSHLASETPVAATFPLGNFLRTPTGVANPACSPDPDLEFELVGCAGPTDPNAEGRHLSAGGAHVIFTSKAHLEGDAAPVGTEAIYDRRAGEAHAEVVSVKADESPFGAGENATYVAATEDGSAVVFSVGGALYVHRQGSTVEVAAAPNTFDGLSEDGKRVFYMDATFIKQGSSPPPAGLFACEVEAGACAGPEKAQEPTEIASDSIFVHVSADGSHAFFTSEEPLAGVEANENGEEAEGGEHNLYAWDGAGIDFMAVLDPRDLTGFSGEGQEEPEENLLKWTRAIAGQGPGEGHGRAYSPTRSTPNGEVFVFQSHARLTSYDNGGHGEIYRATPDGQIDCVSCDPSNAVASADALLQSFQPKGVTNPNTLIPNVTDDGNAVFFQSVDPLLPEDANNAVDIYEWTALGTGSCKRPRGCLSLISSGQGEKSSYLYGMTADGSDLFFATPDKLVGADIPGSPSLYDARIEGGIPDPPTEEDCQGDACQGAGSSPPVLGSPSSVTLEEGGDVRPEGRPRCAKGKRRVVRGGKARCASKRRRKPHHKRHRANANRGARR